MMARWHENLFPVCEELEITFVAFSPLANGFLSGKYTAGTQFNDSEDYRKGMPQFTEDGFARSQKLRELLEKLALEKGRTPAQISLAWVLKKAPFISVIPGSRKLERIQENLESGDTELSDQEMEQIDQLLSLLDLPVYGMQAPAEK